MKSDMNFDMLLMKTLIDCKVNPEDGSFTGYVDTEETFKDLMSKIQACGYCYSIRGSHVYSTSQKTTQMKVPSLAGDDLSSYDNFGDALDVTCQNASNKTFIEKEKTSIHFKSQQGSVPIAYFGLGFTIERNTYFECSQGPRYYKKKLHKGNKLTDTGVPRVIKHRNTSTKKRNCPAVILLKCVRIYPEFTGAGSKEPHWKIKREIADEIRKALKSSPGPLSFLRYYIKASPQSSHSHETEAEKERRLLLKYELKKERSRRYKKARLIRKKQQELVELNSALLLENVIETTSSYMPLETNYISENCLESACVSEELEEVLVENQLELAEHVVTEDGQLLEIKILDEPIQVEEQSEIGKTQVIEVADDDIDTLLLNLRNEAQKIVTLSSNCKDVHAISQAISLLKHATRLIEDPEPLSSTNTDMKRVKIPIKEVFTSHSDNFFTFTLSDSCTKPTCVVFVQ